MHMSNKKQSPIHHYDSPYDMRHTHTRIVVVCVGYITKEMGL